MRVDHEEKRFNAMEATLRHHQGEMKSRTIWCRQACTAGDGPDGAKYGFEDEVHLYWAQKHVCFSLAEAYQYWWGNASDIYAWYCSPSAGKVIKKAKLKT